MSQCYSVSITKSSASSPIQRVNRDDAIMDAALLTKSLRQSPAVEVESQTSSPLLRRAAVSLLLGVQSAVDTRASDDLHRWSADDDISTDGGSSRSSPRDTRHLSPEPCRAGGVSPDPLAVDSRQIAKRQYKNELWASIRSDYAFLMDEEIIDACKSTESEFSSDDMSTESKVSYNEFIQQYNELNDWLGNLRKTVCRQTASHSEGYLNQIYYEEMLNQSPRQCLLNDYAKALLQRYPQLKQEIMARLTHVNDQWVDVLGKLVLPPVNRSSDLTTILSDIERDTMCLRQWINITEETIESLYLSTNWSYSDIQAQLLDHQVMQKDIESKSRIVSAVLKLCIWLSKLNNIDGNMEMERSRLEDDAVRLEQRCHCIWIKSIEWQVRLEDALNGEQQSGSRNCLQNSSSKLYDKLSSSSKSTSNDSPVEMEAANADVIPFRDSEYEEISDADHVLVEDNSEEGEFSEIEDARFDNRINEDLTLSGEWIEPEEEHDLSSDSSSRRLSQKNRALELDQVIQEKKSSYLSVPVTRRECLDVGYSSESYSYDEHDISNGGLIELKEYHTENTDDILGVEPNTGLMYVGPHSLTSAYNSASDMSESHRDLKRLQTERTKPGRKVKRLQPNTSSGVTSLTDVTDSPVTSSADRNPLNVGGIVDDYATDDDFSKLKELSYDDIPMTVVRNASPSQTNYVHVPRRQGRSLDSMLPVDSEKMFQFEKRVSSVEIIMDSLNSSKEISGSRQRREQQLNSSVTNNDNVLSSCDASSEGESEYSGSTTSEEEVGTPTKHKPSRRQRHNKNRTNVTSSPRIVKSPVKRRVDSLTDVSEVGVIDSQFLRSSSDGALNDLAMGYGTIKKSKVSRTKSEIVSPKSSGSSTSRSSKKLKLLSDLPGRKSYHSSGLALYPQSNEDSDTACSKVTIGNDMSGEQWTTSCQDISVISDDSDGQWINESASVQDELLPDDQSQDDCEHLEEIPASRSLGSVRSLQSLQDSDSDTEDFINIVRESHKAYIFTESTLGKYSKEHTGGIVRDPIEFMGPLATCQTNISCLSELIDALQSANRFADAGRKIEQIKDIVSRWQKLEAETTSQQQRCRLLYILYAERIRIEKQLTVISQEVNVEHFDDLSSLELAFRTVQGAQNDLETKINKQIQLLQHKVNQFQKTNPGIDMSRFVAACKLLKETMHLLIDRCSHQQSVLKKSLMSWYQFNELEHHLDYVVCHEQHQIDCLAVATDIVNLSNDDSSDTIGDLKVMRGGWSTYTDKLALMECLRTELVAVCTPVALSALESAIKNITCKIQSVKDKCDELIERLVTAAGSDDGMETDSMLFDNVETSDDVTVLLLKNSVAEASRGVTDETVDTNGDVQMNKEPNEKQKMQNSRNTKCHLQKDESTVCYESEAFQQNGYIEDVSRTELQVKSGDVVSLQGAHRVKPEPAAPEQPAHNKLPRVATVSSSVLNRLLKYALPLPILVMLIFGGLYLLYGDWMDWFDQFGLVLSPQLHHVRGAPPV